MKKLWSAIVFSFITTLANATTYYLCGGTCTGVASVTVTNAGSGYTVAPTITFSSATGCHNVHATATVSGGAITGITVDTAAPNGDVTRGYRSGYGCTSAPSVTITPVSGGSGGAATAVLETAQVGNDANDGLTLGAPKKTKASIKSDTYLKAGNTVILLNGPVAAEVAEFSFTCAAAGAAGTTPEAGTSGSHFVFKTKNERQGWFIDDSLHKVFRTSACHYWEYVGLTVIGTDLGGTGQCTTRGLMEIDSATNPKIWWNLISTTDDICPPGLGNQRHGYLLDGNTGTDFAFNEAWNIRAHAIYMGSGGSAGEYRQSYVFNDRGESISCYYCTNNIFENIFMEGDAASAGQITLNASGTLQNNKYYGIVDYANERQIKPNARGHTTATTPRDNEFHDFVGINMTGAGQFTLVWIQPSRNTQWYHTSMFNSNTGITSGFRFQYSGDTTSAAEPGDCAYSWTVKDSIMLKTGAAVGSGTGLSVGAPPTSGFYCTSGPTMLATWNKVWVNGWSTAFSPSTSTAYATLTNTATTNSGHGNCYLWCPDGAACDGAATDGGDMGATVIKATIGGVLQEDYQYRLWDMTTGQAAKWWVGATLDGVNDGARNLGNFGTRLHVNSGGCAANSADLSATPTPTNTPTLTPTNTPTNTPISTNTPSQTPTFTNTPTRTNTPTSTPTRTNTPTAVPGTPTATPTVCTRIVKRRGEPWHRERVNCSIKDWTFLKDVVTASP